MKAPIYYIYSSKIGIEDRPSLFDMNDQDIESELPDDDYLGQLIGDEGYSVEYAKSLELSNPPHLALTFNPDFFDIEHALDAEIATIRIPYAKLAHYAQKDIEISGRYHELQKKAFLYDTPILTRNSYGVYPWMSDSERQVMDDYSDYTSDYGQTLFHLIDNFNSDIYPVHDDKNLCNNLERPILTIHEIMTDAASYYRSQNHSDIFTFYVLFKHRGFYKP